MDEVVVRLPAMWADHHVLRVREALARAPGVAAVAASAKEREVRVAYDSAATSPDAVAAALAAAGYEAADRAAVAGDGEQSTGPGAGGAPEWSGAPRTTATSTVDLTMSGDYRKY